MTTSPAAAVSPTPMTVWLEIAIAGVLVDAACATPDVRIGARPTARRAAVPAPTNRRNLRDGDFIQPPGCCPVLVAIDAPVQRNRDRMREQAEALPPLVARTPGVTTRDT